MKKIDKLVEILKLENKLEQDSDIESFKEACERILNEQEEPWIKELKYLIGNETLKLGPQVIKAIEINNVAYEIEQQNPLLDFFEVNILTKEIVNKSKLRLVK